jgi:translocation and assembly module TamA
VTIRVLPMLLVNRAGMSMPPRLGRLGIVLLLLALPTFGSVRAEVALTGLSDAQLSNVLAHMRLDDEACSAPEWRVRQAYRAASDDIRAALTALGFYSPAIDGDLQFGASCWNASFEVDPGEPVRIRRLDLQISGQANEDPAFSGLIDAFPLAAGQTLDHGSYESWKRSILDLARARGYIRAAFSTARIDVYPDQRAADISLHFESGGRFNFGAVQLDQDVLDEPLIRSYIDFEQGEPYDAQLLTRLYVALNDSLYFGAIDVHALPPIDSELEIPIAVSLRPGTRLLILYGFGFSTDVGPRVRFGRTNRRLNSRGHQLGINAQFSPVVSEAAVSYRFPYGDPRTEWVSFSGGLRREDTESAFSTSVELGVRRVISLGRNWALSESLNYLTEDYEVADQTGRSRLLMPGLAWSRLRTDSPVRPSLGSRLMFELRAASDSVGSDTSFLQAVASGKWIRSLPSGARILARAELGATAKSEFQNLPPSVRFFAGGDNSVRGFKFKSLGPVDENDEVIGGSALLVGSVEYEIPVRERWSVAGFLDSGNAFEGSNFEPETGAGFGARWHSPVGPIRVDVAWPISQQDSGPRLHISLGPDL